MAREERLNCRLKLFYLTEGGHSILAYRAILLVLSLVIHLEVVEVVWCGRKSRAEWIDLLPIDVLLVKCGV